MGPNLKTHLVEGQEIGGIAVYGPNTGLLLINLLFNA
jgi:hypothetical protein